MLSVYNHEHPGIAECFLLMLAIPGNYQDNANNKENEVSMSRGIESANIYVGCSLTGAPEQFIENVERFKETLRRDYEVAEFVGLEAGTSADVYNWDINNCVENCDLFIGVCDIPSIGLGWELSKSTTLGKLVLAVAHVESKVTRLVLGAAEVEPNVDFRRYVDLSDDVPRYVAEKLAMPRITQ